MKRTYLISTALVVAALAAALFATAASASNPIFSFGFSALYKGVGLTGGTAVDSSGNVWVVSYSASELAKYSNNGEVLVQTFVPEPRDVKMDASGHIWVASDNELVEFNYEGKEIGSVSLIGDVEDPYKFTIDSKGNFWIIDPTNWKVVELSPSGQFLSEINLCYGPEPWECIGEEPGQFNLPAGIVIDPAGNLWITDHAEHGRVEKFSPKGEYLSQVGEGYLTWPEGNAAFDKEGRLWVTDTGNGRVVEFNPAQPKEAPLQTFGESGSGPGQFSKPNSLAFDANGDMWVSMGLQKWVIAPLVTTEAATGVASSEATLNGSVNPNTLETTYQFEYNNGSGWTKVGSPQSAGSGTSPVKESVKVSGLSTNTAYHFRIRADSATHTVYGKLKAFVTGTNAWGVEANEDPSGVTSIVPGGISCASSESCLMVGSYTSSGVQSALAKVKSASGWSLATPAKPSGQTLGGFSDVSCTAANSCIAVGGYQTASTSSTLAERWDGSKWTIQETPNPSSPTRSLTGISCPTANYCMAVGVATEGTTTKTLAERWNGAKWSIVSTPNVEGYEKNSLVEVACVSSSDCWAVGTSTGSGKTETALAEHWNGTTWSINSPAGVSKLTNVSCASSSSCLATTDKLLLARWNGSTWSQETAATPEDAKKKVSGEVFYVSLKDISCTSASACVAVGEYISKTSPEYRPLVEAWNGSTWTVQSSSVPSGAIGEMWDGLSRVSCLSATECTAIGTYSTGTPKTLIEARF
jgi:sugar lactone lactonase YvrE